MGCKARCSVEVRTGSKQLTLAGNPSASGELAAALALLPTLARERAGHNSPA